MTGIGSNTVLAVCLLFCRIGGVLMLMVGISSARVPTQVRLFLAFGLTLAVAPMLIDQASAAITDDTPVTLLRLIVAETFTGLFIGFLGRLFFLALQMLSHAMAMTVGFSMPGASVEDQEALPAMTTLIMLTATLMFFLTDQHVKVLEAVISSYRVLPVAGVFDPQGSLIEVTDTLSAAFWLALRLASPFIIYGLVINFTLGLVNKMTPSIPVYFISMPFVLFGGLMLFYFTAVEFQQLFVLGFSNWLASQ
ncbi:flagellar biosynthetic protein FliR [Pleomorphomonas sp. NRK KF1]|uniref:flagellar biosynthetic protein FliR n=1 Tax=Pleomorphomonas sp. NRK KF1 TaxID=2943000 RepID=UPI002043667E|nr:flagellar biosynthetic protein FliR [Pleomorphomonas sp. NRK KF1]MCM5552041.1 flagellar type III secretion system protein FliR [Pleomorphomonas sp. NRK KF1]